MRLAHFSDLHFPAVDGTRVSDFLNKRALGGLNLLLNRAKHYAPAIFAQTIADVNTLDPELVLCTGDLSNLALPSELAFARARFDELAAGPRRVTCIPGNHDAYVAAAAGNFERAMGPYCTSDAGWENPGGAKWPIVRVYDDVAVIGTCSVYPTSWLTAEGALGDAQRDRLEEILVDPRLDGKARVVMVHHPCAGPHAQRKSRGLLDHEAFAALIARTGAELIIHGHEHEHIHETLTGPGGTAAPVFGIPSGTYDREDPERHARWRVYTLERVAVGARPTLTGWADRLHTDGGFVERAGGGSIR